MTFTKIVSFFSKNWQIVVGGGVLAALVFFVKDYQHQKEEKQRYYANWQNAQDKNVNNLAQFKVVTEELAHILNNDMPELRAKIDSANIKLRRIQRVEVQTIKYIDTTNRSTNLNEILEKIEIIKGDTVGILNPLSIPVIDQTPCLIIRGEVNYNGKSLKLNVKERNFTSINQIVTHIQRNQWKLFGVIKTRLFGKKTIEVTVFNQCGESKTTVLTKSKGKWLPTK